MSRQKKFREAVEESSAAEHSSQTINQVLETIAPLVATAAVKATAARKKAAPLAEQAMDRLQPVAEQAKERIQPLAEQAADRSSELAKQTRKQIQPHLDEAREKVAPHLDEARGKVQEDLVPKLVDLLHQAEGHPAVAEASARSKATVAALKGEIAVPEKKQRNVAATMAKLAAASAVLAAAAVAVRQFLGSKDDEWTAHQPSAAYVNRPEDEEPTAPQASAARNQPATERESSDARLDAAENEPAAAADVTTAPAPEAVMADEGGPAVDETTAENLAVLNEYGEGSYVGDEPPAEFTIKGNERSMKFHTADSAGYERTIADVWFNSVEAAEKAGFTRAQR